MALTPVQEAQVLDLIAQQSALLSLAGVEATILSKLGATKVTLSDLPTASVIDDADLLLLRQGVTDKSVTGLTFKNLIPSTITTPPQFDNDTSIANTEFVQRAIGGYLSYATAGQTIPASAANAKINLSGTASTITLPLASSMPAGSTLTFKSTLACTISRQSTDTIFANSANSALTSIPITDGGNLTFFNAGSGVWVVTGNDAISYSQIFANSLIANGYQVLPSGLIMQWGPLPNTADDGTANITWPIAFPNTCFLAVATADTFSINYEVWGLTAKTTTTGTFRHMANGSSSGGYYIALGK